MNYARIIGTGGYLPKNKVSNNNLAKLKKLDTSDKWIIERTGIKTRHIAEDDETSLSMANEAATQAIKNSNLDKDDIDLIIYASCTPSGTMPSDACKIQQRLGIPAGAAAFDINASCSGFVYAAATADQFIRGGLAKCALIIGSDKMTSLLDWNNRSTCVLFGDGAGAMILKADTYPGIMSSLIGANGSKSQLLYTDNNNFIQMSGQDVFKQAVKTLEKIVGQIIAPVGLDSQDIDWLIPHQANIRIIQCTAKMLNMPLERVVQTITDHANTSAASIPLALNSIIDQIKPGEHLLIEAFGAGFTWGGMVIKY